jgi:non-specific serine/threonine protein kinase
MVVLRTDVGMLGRPLPVLVGRSDDLAALRRLIEVNRERLVTLVGPGGVGKTSLAQVGAHAIELAEQRPVPFVELAAISEDALMLPAIAAALGVESSAPGALLAAVVDALGEDAPLLILDNLEQLPGAPAVIQALLDAHPGLRVLATSRIRTRLPDEVVLEVEPLATPDRDDAPGTPETMRQFSAVELFETRVRTVQPDFRLADDNVAEVVSIVRQLDGLPLAIELVASRARHFTVPELQPRLIELLPLPEPAADRLPGRQRTVMASIAWSVDLLPEPVREALARLSVFPARFDLAAARAVADAGISEIDTLIDHHLVQLAERDGARNRFVLPESVRQFGLNRLREAGRETNLRDRHAAWRHALTDRIERDHFGPNWRVALRRHLETIDDFHQAIAWAIERRNLGQAIGLFTDLSPHWSSLPWETAELWWRRIEPLIEIASVNPGLLARGLIEAGRVAYGAGDLRESDRRLVRATRLARQAGDENILALALRAHGSTLRGLTETDRAAELLAELRSLSSCVTEPFARFATFLELGAQAMMIQADYATAWDDFQHALAVARQARAVTQEGNALHFLGYVAAMRGDLDVARDAFQRAIRLQGEGPETQRLAILHGLGRTELLAGRYADAYTAFREALAGRYKRGETLQVRFILTDLALLARATGRPRLAAEWFGAANLDQLLLTDRRFFADRWIEAVAQTRAELGDDAFERGLDRGRLIGLDDAVAAALALSNPPAAGIDAAQTGETALSPRELQVLRLLVEGASDRQIGDTLFISPLTATRHVKNILRKLDVSTRTAAATLAVRKGLIRPD